MERIGGEGRLLVTAADGKPVHDRTVTTKDHADALATLAALPDGPFDKRGLIGFGHRVVHGGPDLDAPVLVDAATLARIVALEPLAPLHNPPAVAVLKALAELFPKLPHVACFDTAFHRGHPAVADRFAIPDALYREGVRRYGFHGLSYEYIAGALAERVPEIALGRVVVAHLGSGASMCALAGGRSVDSSMGFTALDGLPMGTRPGSLDAGVILWLQQQKGWSVDQVEHFLYADCGLKGLSGVSNDMRTLLASEAPLAKAGGGVLRLSRGAHCRRDGGQHGRHRWHGVHRRDRRTQRRDPRPRAASAALARLLDRRGGEPGWRSAADARRFGIAGLCDCDR